MTYGGDPIPKSPFSVGVSPGLDLGKIKISGLDDSKGGLEGFWGVPGVGGVLGVWGGSGIGEVWGGARGLGGFWRFGVPCPQFQDPLPNSEIYAPILGFSPNFL